MTRQWLRSCSLRVGPQSGEGIELAGLKGTNQVLRIRFTVNYFTVQTPANLHARIYNLSPTTINTIIGYASQGAPSILGVPFATSARVILEAGYVDDPNDQTIFKGQIYQLRVGKENATDSYLDIYAADGDLAHTYGAVSMTLPKGQSAVDQWNGCGKGMQPFGATTGKPPDGLPTTGSPRCKVLYGPSRDVLRTLGKSYNFNWNVLDGKLQALPVGGYFEGEAIDVNFATGQINVPEQTENGVTVVTLLNPKIHWGTLVHLDNNEIAHSINNTQANYSVNADASIGAQTAVIPPLNSDGLYVVLCASHHGDTRNNEWYTKFTCLSIDPTAPKPTAKPLVKYPDILLGSGATPAGAP